jgi:hypothetical protein
MSFPVRDIEHAFPTTFPDPEYGSGYRGVSLRDYFAAVALQGWLASYGSEAPHPIFNETAMNVALNSYSMADAMLAARKEGA